jgi:hypothetical protein
MIQWFVNVAGQPVFLLRDRTLPPFFHYFCTRSNKISPFAPSLPRSTRKKTSALPPLLHSSPLFHSFCTRSYKTSPFAPSLPRSPRKKTNALPQLLHSSSLFHYFRMRSNKISPLVSTTSTLFFTLKKISPLFSNSSQKHPGVGGGIVSLPAISRDNQLGYTLHKFCAYPGLSVSVATVSQVLWNQQLRKKGGGSRGSR